MASDITYPGQVGPSDVATLSLLGRGAYGYGGGMHVGNETLAAGAHADGTAVAAKVDANSSAIEQQTVMFDAAERSRQFSSVGDQIDSVRFQLADNAKESAKCCCEAKLEAQKNSNDLTAQILAVESRGITRELDRAERKLESSESTGAIVAALREQSQVLNHLVAQMSNT